MCGIAGFLTSRALERDPLDVLRRMTGAIAHRGPDADGHHWNAEAGVALGHRRLSIVDLSREGAQPMESAGRRYVIVFNGEVYNFRALRAELEAFGHRFRGHSDTEVMLAAIEQWGLLPAVERFVGMFAFALWDRELRTLSLVRDRFGKKPLYLWTHSAGAVFGSELKALRRFPEFPTSIDRAALTSYMRFGYVPAPHSIYEGVRKVRPGTIVTLDLLADGGVRESAGTYWDANAARARSASRSFAALEGEGLEELDRVLRLAVAERMVADVPLGAFLSGGVDSSLVVALMQAQSTTPVRTFTIGFDSDAHDEAKFALAVARHLGTSHEETRLSPQDALDRVPRLPAIFDEPFADSSQIPTLLVSEVARRKVTVALSGDGGDEVFCGYNRYVLGGRMWRRLKVVPSPLRRAMVRGIHAVGPERWNAVLLPLQKALPRRLRVQSPGDRLAKFATVLGLDSQDAFYLRLVSQWPDPERLVLGGTEAPRAWRIAESPDVASFTEQMMLLDTTTYLPDDILVKVDRASMAVSLEARAPLLDHRVYECAWRLPLDAKLRNGVGKYALRQVLYRHVPRELIDRPKTGFGIPLAEWLRGPLRPWAEDLLQASRLRAEGYFDPALVGELWEQHVSGARQWQYVLWNVLMFQAWAAERS